MLALRSVILLILVIQIFSNTCEDSNKDQNTCLSTSEDGVTCAFCSSGAVGNTCLKETDAKGLPSSVFKCTYKTLSTTSSTCETSNKDKATCLSASESGEKCVFCTSGAVGNTCLKSSDAQGLPSSVFKCSSTLSVTESFVDYMKSFMKF